MRIELLRKIDEYEPQDPQLVDEEEIEALRGEIGRLRQQYSVIKNKIRETQAFTRHINGFSEEIGHQHARLHSIKAFAESAESVISTCPLCKSALENELPSVAVLNQAYENLGQELSGLRQETPRIEGFVRELEKQTTDLRGEIRGREQRIDSRIGAFNAAKKYEDNRVRIGRVLGRISLFLESLAELEDSVDLKRRINALKLEIEAIEQELSADNVDEAIDSILNQIGVKMTEYAVKLKLAYSTGQYRLNIKKLTVIADTKGRPIPMERQGSAQNWLGCHLINTLGLHDWFIQNERPVPRFLFIDQPSQVYFPSRDIYENLDGTKEKTEQVKDADLAAVERIFELFFDFCEEQEGKFQIIVTEHANLPSQKFQNALVEAPINTVVIPDSTMRSAQHCFFCFSLISIQGSNVEYKVACFISMP